MRHATLAFFLSAAVLPVSARQHKNVSGMQPEALKAAQERGRFDLNCPAATAQVLSNEMVQTRSTGPVVGWDIPPQRAEYTVGVDGCGHRSTYVVVCAEGGTGCVAAAGRNTAQANDTNGKPPSPQ